MAHFYWLMLNTGQFHGNEALLLTQAESGSAYYSSIIIINPRTQEVITGSSITTLVFVKEKNAISIRQKYRCVFPNDTSIFV